MKDKNNELDEIFFNIISHLPSNEIPTLYILRGLPTSGKSYIGTKLSNYLGITHLEPDKLLTHSLIYDYTTEKMENSRLRCKKFIYENLPFCDIVISDVFPRKVDVKDLIAIALELGCNYKVISLPKYTYKNIINRIKNRYESGYSLISEFNLNDLKTMIEEYEDWN